MVGKGSVNHNSRQFHAKNTDPARSHLNKEYVNDDIRAVYHELFDEAIARYNARQTRQDRCIGNYYEKIRSGKQEKPFHELILQIGSKDDCGTETPEGGKAAQMLDEYSRASNRETLRCGSSPHICIWTRQHPICTSTLSPTRPAASVVWKRGFP